MYTQREKQSGYKFDKDYKAYGQAFRITSMTNTFFNVYINGQEVGCFSDYSDRLPFQKCNDWIEDNQKELRDGVL